MKYLKYVVMCVATLLFIPKVYASQTVKYTEYKVGDEITVHLDKQNGNVTGKFRVIASSAAGVDEGQPDNKIDPKPNASYQYVTAIYEGTIGEIVYTEHPASKVSFIGSNLQSYLNTTVKNLGWITPDEIRLLRLSDLRSMFNSPVPTYISAHLKKDYPWLVLKEPYWLEEDGYTDLTETDCQITTSGAACGPKEKYVARIISETGAFTILDQTEKAAVRPVIKVHKGFVEGGMDCSNGPTPIEPEPTPTPEPKTCPEKPSISIQDCLDAGKEEAVCIAERCGDDPEPVVPTTPSKEETFCPNDKKISIQSCIDGGMKEEDCIKKLCPGTKKPENPKTGTYISIGILVSGMVAGIVYFLMKKKKYFRKI